MKAKEVMQVLRISRSTLHVYITEGKLTGTKLPNGQYDYNAESVYAILNKDVPRKTYIYARVSTASQRADLTNQINILKEFCFSNGYVISGVYQDIASGISFENRKEFFKLLDDVIAGKVCRVVITYKDRLSRVGFDLFKHLFAKYNCEIVVISEISSTKLDSEEIFEDIVSLLHCYSTKLYSKRRIAKIREVLADDSSAN